MLCRVFSAVLVLSSYLFLALGLLTGAVICLGFIVTVANHYSVFSIKGHMGGWTALAVIGLRAALYLLWAMIFRCLARMSAQSGDLGNRRPLSTDVLRRLGVAFLLVACVELFQIVLSPGVPSPSQRAMSLQHLEDSDTLHWLFFMASETLKIVSAYEAALGLRFGIVGALFASAGCMAIQRCLRGAKGLTATGERPESDDTI